MAIVEHPQLTKETRETQWPELLRRIARTAKRRNLNVLWPEFASDSKLSGAGDFTAANVLFWGSGSIDGINSSIPVASRIAAGQSLGPVKRAVAPEIVDLAGEIERFLDRFGSSPLSVSILTEAVAWGYAMPRLAIDIVQESASKKMSSKDTSGKTPASKNDPTLTIDAELWWTLLGELQTISRGAIDQLSEDSPERLLAAGELGAVLAWQLSDLPSCAAMREESLDSIGKWFGAEGDAVSAAVVEGGGLARLVLASALRSRRLAARLKRRISTKRSAAAIDLATWAAAMTRADGSVMLGPVGVGKDDVRADGLFAIAAQEIGGEALQTALDATIGKTKSHGRLAWQVQLPEPAWFDETAGLAVMLPEWDVRRGRLALHYKNHDRQIQFEVSGGKHLLASGIWGARLWKDETELKPLTNWNDLCWYSDDDVHYLELEQRFEGNVKVQRQILMLRDDHCIMLADAVMGSEGDKLKFASELPLATDVHVEEQAETREVVLADGKRRALVMPLAMSEWKVGPTAGAIRIIDKALPEQETTSLNLVAEVRGEGAIYSPIWIDLDRKRIKAQKTWRKLTVGEKLRLIPSNEAAAFRVQLGSDQWVIYRSLNGHHNRTFLGKNLISDFFCGRFDAEDGSIEELVSVDEQPE